MAAVQGPSGRAAPTRLVISRGARRLWHTAAATRCTLLCSALLLVNAREYATVTLQDVDIGSEDTPPRGEAHSAPRNQPALAPLRFSEMLAEDARRAHARLRAHSSWDKLDAYTRAQLVHAERYQAVTAQHYRHGAGPQGARDQVKSTCSRGMHALIWIYTQAHVPLHPVLHAQVATDHTVFTS